MTESVLAGRTAVVTGAASGIGLAIATCFAGAGAHVVVSDIRAQSADEVVTMFMSRGWSASAYAADASVDGDVIGLVDHALAQSGSLDILVNNAGTQHVANLEEFPIGKFRAMIDLMLVGPFIATRYAFPAMKRQKFGRILNVASVNGLIGFAGKAAYNSAKHGVIGLTKVAALEGAEFGITANALCPGYVDTPLVRNQLAALARHRGISDSDVLEEVIYPLVPQRRLLLPQEVADYALFLVSKASSVTGQAVVLDGGYLAQ